MLDVVFTTIGYFGSFFLSMRLFPVLYDAIKKEDFVTPLYFLFLEILTCICFLCYSIYFFLLPMIIANVVSLLISLIVSFMYKKAELYIVSFFIFSLSEP